MPSVPSKDRRHAPTRPTVARIARREGPALRRRAGHDAHDRSQFLRGRPAGPHHIHGDERGQPARRFHHRLSGDGFHRQLGREGPLGQSDGPGHAPAGRLPNPRPGQVVHADGDLGRVAERRGTGNSDGDAPGPLRPRHGPDDIHHRRARPAFPVLCLAPADLPAPGGAIRRQRLGRHRGRRPLPDDPRPRPGRDRPDQRRQRPASGRTARDDRLGPAPLARVRVEDGRRRLHGLPRPRPARPTRSRRGSP